MKLADLTVAGATGNSRWLPVNPWLYSPIIGLALWFSEDANLTAGVQYTYDDPMQTPRKATYTRAAGVLTITDNGHNLNAGDNVRLSQDSNGNFNSVQSDGGSDIVATATPNTYTIAVPNAGAVAGTIFLQSFRVFKHPTMGNQVGGPPARIDGQLNWGVGAYRLNVSVWASGGAGVSGQQGKGI